MKLIQTYKIDDTTYEVETFPCRLSDDIAEVYIYEVVRPNWKIFRRSYLSSYNFFVAEFETIEQGAIFTFKKYLDKVERLNAIKLKWENITK